MNKSQRRLVVSKSSADSEEARRVAEKYAVRITQQIRETIKGLPSQDPVALQYMPQMGELATTAAERLDPIGDKSHSPVKGIVHRHADRLLLTLTHLCAAYCRFCFRREETGKPENTLSQQDQKEALSYIKRTLGLREVIFTGGDPLILAPAKLKAVLDEIASMDHIDVMRFHTRIPLSDPARVTPELLDLLRAVSKALYIVVHVNHAQEINDAVRKTFCDLRETGAVLLSQSVLLNGVNDSVKAMEDLFRELVKNRVKPYYLHHPDLAPGTHHFRVSIEKGQRLMKELRSRLSGLCLPEYVLDIPGGFGKIPLTPSYLENLGDGRYRVEDHHGNKHVYDIDSHD